MSVDLYIDGVKYPVRSLSSTGFMGNANGMISSVTSSTVKSKSTVTKPNIDTSETKPVSDTPYYSKGYNDGYAEGKELGMELGADTSTHTVYAEIILTTAASSNAWISCEIDLYIDGVKYIAKPAQSIGIIFPDRNGLRAPIQTNTVTF